LFSLFYFDELFKTLTLLYLIIFTPLLHKDVVESTACPHQKAVSTFLRITSKGHSWIDPGDGIDLTAIPLWVRF
jgi:hypothetical protein